MKCIKNQLFGLLALGLGHASSAQVKFPVTDDDLRLNLQKIVAGFPGNLSTVRGDTIEINPQTIEFSTLLDFKQAPQNSIIQYRSPKPVYSWQAMLLNTEEFEVAAKKYKWLCNQLKVMTIKIDGGYTFTLNGNYDEADDSKKFSSSIYKLTPNAVNMPKLKIEAALQFEFPEWKVSLLVYEREREDKDRGDIHGD
jgi:hypothetical protein